MSNIVYQRPFMWLASLLTALLGFLALHMMISVPVSTWFALSVTITLCLAATAVALIPRYGFFAIIGALFSAITAGRLFGTLRAAGGVNVSSDPLLLAETGPGVPHLMWLATALAVVLITWLILHIRPRPYNEQSVQPSNDQWALFFVRLYVALMFIPHFAGHILVGPAPFAIFADYFASIGLRPGAAMVVLGGLAEVTAGVGLALGLFTRLAALIGATFLALSMYWGNHFAVGYVWILPTGGWEFGIFWAVIVGLFAIIGGGPLSLDRRINWPGLRAARTSDQCDTDN